MAALALRAESVSAKPSLTFEARRAIEAEIDRLISLLDAIDGDPDLETFDPDLEDDDDDRCEACDDGFDALWIDGRIYWGPGDHL